MIDEAAMVEVVDAFTATVTGDFSVEDILRQLAEAVARVLEVDGAGVMAPAHDSLLRFVFATSDPSRMADQMQEVLQDGPCVAAAASGEIVNVGDLTHEGDWPLFQARAVDAGLHAVTAIPLRARDTTWGVLDLYRERAERLDDAELAAAVRLANLATSYLVVTADRDTARTAQAALAHHAMHDPLTGLPVRWVFLEQLTHALTRLHRHPERGLAVLFLDIDGLKYVNDTFGHPAGDRLITECVARATYALRPSDLMARLGGDEFVLLLEDVDAAAASSVAERVLAELRVPYQSDTELIRPSASIGIVVTDDPHTTPDVLIAHADTAMYAAKHDGRGRYRVFDPSAYAVERAEASARETLTAQLRAALAEDQLEVHYQPIVDLTDGPDGAQVSRRPWAVEALVRWRHPDLGTIPASQFVPLAESTGLVVEMGGFVLREACAQLAVWRADEGEHAPERLFVNLSAAEIADPALPGLVGELLREHGLQPGQLTLEITEGELLTEPAVTAAAVQALRDLGCELAIDDFGTGHSSLSRLLEIPASTLKVDQSFSRGLPTRRDAAAIVSSVLLLGHNLRRTVVVEGVEDALTLETLHRLGATHVQGYHLARPQTAVDLAATWH
ncbi:putative bifunctional diguanylate cyclase/phosphodiesterase [Angustibacter aerolatus]